MWSELFPATTRSRKETTLCNAGKARNGPFQQHAVSDWEFSASCITDPHTALEGLNWPIPRLQQTQRWRGWSGMGGREDGRERGMAGEEMG